MADPALRCVAPRRLPYVDCPARRPRAEELEGKPDSFAAHVAAPAAAGAVQVISSPPENYAFHVEAAAQKHHYPFPKLFVLGVLAGARGRGRTPASRREAQTCASKHALEASPPTLPCPYASPAGAYIGLGYSLCSLVGGQLSKEFRLEQPGAFNFLFGIFGARGTCCSPGRWLGVVRRVAAGWRLRCFAAPHSTAVLPSHVTHAHQRSPLAPSRPSAPAPGPAGFPMGLTLCVVAGADLFTSNCM